MNNIQQECLQRGITRVCHFTQSRNLAHIFGDYLGILSTKTLRQGGLPHNPTDPKRLDKCDHLISCSIEYPNPNYFKVVRRREPLFEDWVVLFMNMNLIWKNGTKYCPCNAATSNGFYIGDRFSTLFASSSLGARGGQKRSQYHLFCSPTDIQAEVLIPEPIQLGQIDAIAVQSKEQANKEFTRMKLQGISFNKKIYVVSDFFSNNDTLVSMVQSGRRVEEKLYDPENTLGD